MTRLICLISPSSLNPFPIHHPAPFTTTLLSGVLPHSPPPSSLWCPDPFTTTLLSLWCPDPYTTTPSLCRRHQTLPLGKTDQRNSVALMASLGKSLFPVCQNARLELNMQTSTAGTENKVPSSQKRELSSFCWLEEQVEMYFHLDFSPSELKSTYCLYFFRSKNSHWWVFWIKNYKLSCGLVILFPL